MAAQGAAETGRTRTRDRSRDSETVDNIRQFSSVPGPSWYVHHSLISHSTLHGAQRPSCPSSSPCPSFPSSHYPHSRPLPPLLPPPPPPRHSHRHSPLVLAPHRCPTAWSSSPLIPSSQSTQRPTTHSPLALSSHAAVHCTVLITPVSC